MDHTHRSFLFRPNQVGPIPRNFICYFMNLVTSDIGITSQGFRAEFGALQVPFAIAPVLLFASFTSWWMYILTLVLISWAVQSINGGMRIEAEIEADHAALQQLMFFKYRDSAFSKAAFDLLGTDEELFVTDDKRLLNPGNWLRREIFAKMKKDARASILRRFEYYIWLAARSWEYKAIMFDLAAILGFLYVVEFREVSISWLSVSVVVGFAVVMYLFFSMGKMGILLRLRRLIREKNSAGVDRSSFSDLENSRSAASEIAGPVGDVSVMGESELSRALVLNQAALRVARDLARADPGNAAWQRLLAETLTKVGDVLVQQRQPVKAMQYHGESLGIRRALAKAAPANAELQNELSTGYEGVGKALMELGDREAALFNQSEVSRDRS